MFRLWVGLCTRGGLGAEEERVTSGGRVTPGPEGRVEGREEERRSTALLWLLSVQLLVGWTDPGLVCVGEEELRLGVWSSGFQKRGYS